MYTTLIEIAFNFALQLYLITAYTGVACVYRSRRIWHRTLVLRRTTSRTRNVIQLTRPPLNI